MLILNVWLWLGPLISGIVCLLIGFVVGFLVCRKVQQNYMEKNPPITEEMVYNMMCQMGRKPSKKQVKAVMATMQPNRK